MSMMKMAMTGMVGFAVGAGLMLWPGNQKLKKQMKKQVDHIQKMTHMW